MQGSDSIEMFITKLRLAAKDCNFAETDGMIRDRVVFDTSSSKIREKLINEGEKLTLDKAIQIAQNFEYSREQLKTMAANADDNIQQQAQGPVHAVRKQGTRAKFHPKQHQQHAQNTPKQHHQNAQGNQKCGNCGNSHSRQTKCPAQGKQCHFVKNGTTMSHAAVPKRIVLKNLSTN